MPGKYNPLFRRATSADIPAMSRIRLCVTENALSDPTRITHEMYEDFLEQSGRGWVAENDGDILAFCYADSINASIWALFVSPGHEGHGFGQSLLKLAVDWLFDIGHDRICLTTGANTRADRFYLKQGWTRAPVSATDIGYSLTRSGAIANRGHHGTLKL
jgi:GNAT superfamily N-acetyltransferase